MKQLTLRWVTWWPAPYWTPRFNALASQPELDFEALFLAPGVTYHDWESDRSVWQFSHRILGRHRASSGYQALNWKLTNVLPVVRSAYRLRVVMPYSDPNYLAIATLARARRVPYFLFVASTHDDRRTDSRLNEALKQLAFRHAAGCLATGPLQRDYARCYTRAPERITIIGNPTDTRDLNGDGQVTASRRRRHRVELGWEGRFVVLFVGRLAPEKDLRTLLAAASMLAHDGLPITVALAGAGPCEEELKSCAGALGVDLRLLGFRQGSELGRAYAAADAFVLPSTSEPWGLVVNEAMEFGLPVVLSDCVGSRPLVGDNEAGLIYPAGDADALAGHLRALSRDTQLRQRIADQARERIRAESVDRWVDAVMAAVVA